MKRCAIGKLRDRWQYAKKEMKCILAGSEKKNYAGWEEKKYQEGNHLNSGST